MSSRRDLKGRILWKGESQRADGMYMFRYTDKEGKRQTIYSWKLVSTDKIPKSKKTMMALRDMEAEIMRDLHDGIDRKSAETITLDAQLQEFMSLRIDLKESTRCTYLNLYKKHIAGRVGRYPLAAIKHTFLVKLYTELIEKDNLDITTVEKLHSLICQLFEMAVNDDLLRSNPASNTFKTLRRKYGADGIDKKRHALTKDQQAEFIRYVYNSERFNKYHALFVILLGTGLRIGEALGLRWDDCNFDEEVISINHSLAYKESYLGDGKTGGYRYRITPPKTSAGYREIPMMEDVKKAILAEKKRKNRPKSFEVDGYKNFIFINSHGQVYTPAYIYDLFQEIVRLHNLEEKVAAAKENREPVLIPKISAHILRHTFCTRICENEQNLKVIQEVMGHSDIRTTMNVYNEATKEAKKKSFERFNDLFKISGSV